MTRGDVSEICGVTDFVSRIKTSFKHDEQITCNMNIPLGKAVYEVLLCVVTFSSTPDSVQELYYDCI
jgi:hypothetical protein